MEFNCDNRLAFAVEGIVMASFRWWALWCPTMMWLAFTTSSKAKPNTDQAHPQLRVRSWAEFWSLMGALFGEIPGNHRRDAVGIGSRVRIRSSFSSPLPGSSGVV